MATISFSTYPLGSRLQVLRAAQVAQKRTTIWLLVLLSLLVYGNAVRLLSSHSYASTPATAINQLVPTSITSTTNAGATTPIITPAPQTPTPAVVTVPAPKGCNPTAYALPSAFDLSAQPAGLTQVVDPLQTYRIYGNTPAQIRSQIQNCGPKEADSPTAEFTAQTGYQVTWRYDYAERGDGMCALSNAKLGMHIAMIAPQWQASDTAQLGLASTWQSFIGSLLTHENGHVALDQQYAAQMLSDMQNFPATSCDTIQASVSRVLQNDVNNLNIANDRYDTSTNHGASQGAVLPS